MRHPDAPLASEEIHDILKALMTGATVGFEALCRGPEGSQLRQPAELFQAARSAG